MSRTYRKERLEELLRRELGSMISSELSDPRLRDITLMDVEVSADLQTARVFISVLEEDVDLEQVKDGLHSARGYMRSMLASRLTLRKVPELVFRVNRSVIETRQIDALLEQIVLPDNNEPNTDGEKLD